MWIRPNHCLLFLWRVFWIFGTAFSAFALVPRSFFIRTIPAKTVTCRYLFVQPSNTEPPSIGWKVPSSEIDCSRPKTFPWSIVLQPSLPWILTNSTRKVLTVRSMRLQDLDPVVNMCVHEYGSGPVDFPLWNPLLYSAWLDRQYLCWLVATSCLIKLLLYDHSVENSITSDHMILVAVLNDHRDDKRNIVGMVEISLQPLMPNQTPPPFPLPLLLKKASAFIFTGRTELVGWITNLLIPSAYRGNGYSKALMLACEAVANSWHCSSIHLHCDADPKNGHVPQKLYSRLGYRSSTLSPCIVEIEGVSLLYLRKAMSETMEVFP